MTGVLPILLSVMFLSEPDEVVDAAVAESVSRDADLVYLQQGQGERKTFEALRITSRMTDFDRMEGVVMFEGDVVVRYADDCTMCADRLYMFLAGSNELNRVVAIGNVSITNETRVGICSMATYRRKRNEIEMFGDGNGCMAHLSENGDSAGALEGSRIRFWLDAEQVEVEDSGVSVRQGEGARLL